MDSDGKILDELKKANEHLATIGHISNRASTQQTMDSINSAVGDQLNTTTNVSALLVAIVAVLIALLALLKTPPDWLVYGIGGTIIAIMVILGIIWLLFFITRDKLLKDSESFRKELLNQADANGKGIDSIKEGGKVQFGGAKRFGEKKDLEAAEGKE